MFILVVDEVYNHFCWWLIFWWPLKLQSTESTWDRPQCERKRLRFLFNVERLQAHFFILVTF